VRWAFSMVLILATGSMATGVFAAGPRTVPRTPVKEVGDPARAEGRVDDPPRPAGGTVATLRARWPVHGPVNSGFGPRGSLWSKHYHTGVDIGTRRGTAVRATAAGTVTFAGWRNGYGRTIVIDHGRQVRTVYGHLSKLDVRRNQRVVAGTEVGLTGATGNASGPHLHYEIRVNGRPVDPRDRAPGSPRGSDQRASLREQTGNGHGTRVPRSALRRTTSLEGESTGRHRDHLNAHRLEAIADGAPVPRGRA
jgi:murein DD-endopeptidase MepM/ murein hydrolase activator NlpD